MRCPYCRYPETKVLETRETEGNTRRRRECLRCAKRFTTYEQAEQDELTVIKKDGRREAFDRDKLLNGLRRACEKRPIEQAQLERAVEDIEARLINHKKSAVKSSHIGEMAMRRLKKLDNIAYLRFASVYRDFADITSFQDEVRQLVSENKQKKALSE
ncbi:transcriptional repressor NrdR [Candidatus Woesearchaeota archaeon]|nr:transcriptional repressor NrdR [Candidatus Woesearchaeota archaeon]